MRALVRPSGWNCVVVVSCWTSWLSWSQDCEDRRVHLRPSCSRSLADPHGDHMAQISSLERSHTIAAPRRSVMIRGTWANASLVPESRQSRPRLDRDSTVALFKLHTDFQTQSKLWGCVLHLSLGDGCMFVLVYISLPVACFLMRLCFICGSALWFRCMKWPGVTGICVREW